MEISKLDELKLQNLFLLRNILSQTLIVLTGGIVGMFFANYSLFKIVFVIIGVILEYCVIQAFMQVGSGIKKILYYKRGVE